LFSRLKEGFQLRLCGLFGGLFLQVRRGFPKNKIITEITPALFNDPFRLRLTTIIIGAPHIEDAIEATVKVGSAKDAEILSAYRGLDFQSL
jgi:hypothetical protein